MSGSRTAVPRETYLCHPAINSTGAVRMNMEWTALLHHY